MSADDSPASATSKRDDADVTPRMSSHAGRRFRKRAALTDAAAARSWRQAERIDIGRTTLDGDEARYDPAHRVVHIRQGNTVATILPRDDGLRDSVTDELERHGWSD